MLNWAYLKIKKIFVIEFYYWIFLGLFALDFCLLWHSLGDSKDPSSAALTITTIAKKAIVNTIAYHYAI
jgi:hypothetical protein